MSDPETPCRFAWPDELTIGSGGYARTFTVCQAAGDIVDRDGRKVALCSAHRDIENVEFFVTKEGEWYAELHPR